MPHETASQHTSKSCSFVHALNVSNRVHFKPAAHMVSSSHGAIGQATWGLHSGMLVVGSAHTCKPPAMDMHLAPTGQLSEHSHGSDHGSHEGSPEVELDTVPVVGSHVLVLASAPVEVGVVSVSLVVAVSEVAGVELEASDS